MITTIEASYRTVTPLFSAGADPGGAELRLPGFKGMLRFWWRALAWSRYGGSLEMIKKQEDALFGSAVSGQSRVIMHLDSSSDLKVTSCGTVLTKSQSNTNVVGEGARYLGYGVMEAFAGKKTVAGQLKRDCFRAPVEFSVRLRGRGLAGAEQKLLENALLAMGTLGGMGARSRRGYGSLVLRSLQIDGVDIGLVPSTVEELATAIGNLCPGSALEGVPEFTAFSKGTRHVLLFADGRDPLDLLDLVGREFVRFRSWGRGGKILGNVDSEKRFRDDHDLMKEPFGTRTTHPRRIAFGLPHNYGKPKEQQVRPQDFDRRASPLFIHIHECGGTSAAVISFFPAQFLPENKPKISVGGKEVPKIPEEELYRPIRDFLDRLLDDEQRREPFTRAVEVRP